MSAPSTEVLFARCHDEVVRLLAENERLRAANEHLLQFVFQKCPQCGIVVAPDPAKQWPGVPVNDGGDDA